MMNFTNPNDYWLRPELMKDLEPEESQAVGCLSLIGYVVAIIVGICLFTLFGSCRSSKNIIEKRRDSIRVETKTETILVPDTVIIEIPKQSAVRESADSISHLENDFATSDARLLPDGTLFHSLETKPQKIPVEVEKMVEIRDSIVYVEKTGKQTIKQKVEVETPLSWWQQTQIYGCYVLAVLLVVIYCKPIWRFVRRVILRLPS